MAKNVSSAAHLPCLLARCKQARVDVFGFGVGGIMLARLKAAASLYVRTYVPAPVGQVHFGGGRTWYRRACAGYDFVLDGWTDLPP